MSLIGSSPGVFLGLTLVFMGGCAVMTGQALAGTWRPAWQLPPYGLLLGAADRFLAFALFHQPLLSPAGFLVDAALLTVIGGLAFRLTRARQMASQYPWLYRRRGLFGWRQIAPDK